MCNYYYKLRLPVNDVDLGYLLPKRPKLAKLETEYLTAGGKATKRVPDSLPNPKKYLTLVHTALHSKSAKLLEFAMLRSAIGLTAYAQRDEFQ